MLRWELDGEHGRCGGYEVELRPFLGVLGMPPVEPGVHSTGPPRPQGGNIDCAELVAGTTLFLPIPFDGALFSAGDGHARQGDGEVSGTAIECPAEATLTLVARRRPGARLAGRADRRRVDRLRLRRGSRPRRRDREGGHAVAHGPRARCRAWRRPRSRERGGRPARHPGRQRGQGRARGPPSRRHTLPG